MTAVSSNTASPDIATAAEAEQLMSRLIAVMDALLGVIEQETELVRAGKLVAAAGLEPRKQELSQQFLADTARVKANDVFLAKTMPAALKALRQRHEEFRAIVQINMTVLATAHAVSESIMRGVSNELARKATPQGYGASGRSVKPGAAALQPLTVSRVL